MNTWDRPMKERKQELFLAVLRVLRSRHDDTKKPCPLCEAIDLLRKATDAVDVRLRAS